MNISKLPFPITIVAPDGWAAYKQHSEGFQNWRLPGFQKYRRIGFVVADSEGRVWRMSEIVPVRAITLWDRMRSIFGHHTIPVRIVVDEMTGDALTIFRGCFAVALDKDCDCLTQFHSRDKIDRVLNYATSLPKLIERLHRMRVT